MKAMEQAAYDLHEAFQVDLRACAAHQGQWRSEDCDCAARAEHLRLAQQRVLDAALSWANANPRRGQPRHAHAVSETECDPECGEGTPHGLLERVP